MRLHIALDQGDVRQARPVGPAVGDVEHGLGQVDAVDRARRADGSGGRQGGGATPAADVHDALAGREVGGGQENVRDGGEDAVAPVGVGHPVLPAVAVPCVVL